jgi:hypothetical protein
MPPNEMALVNVKTKPIVLAPGQSIHDLSLTDILDRGIDWFETAKHSLYVKNVGDGK